MKLEIGVAIIIGGIMFYGYQANKGEEVPVLEEKVLEPTSIKTVSTQGKIQVFKKEKEELLLLPVSNSGPLPAKEAFKYSLSEDKSQILFSILPEYYMYKGKTELRLNGEVLNIDFPKGKIKDDPLFGKTETYTEQLILEVPDTKGKYQIKYQGCWTGGVCYPPMSELFEK
jgi:thiol:disulfide interchange protein